MTEKTKPLINRADVLRMAQEAGAGHFGHDKSVQIVTPEVLERFAAIVAAMVAAHEREACAKARNAKPRQLPKVGTGALLDEQQFCYEKGWKEGVAALRKAIRARGAA